MFARFSQIDHMFGHRQNTGCSFVFHSHIQLTSFACHSQLHPKPPFAKPLFDYVIYIYIYIHIHVHICVSLSLSIYIYIYIYRIHIHVCIHMYIYIYRERERCIYLSLSLYIYIYIYIYMYRCTRVHVYVYYLSTSGSPLSHRAGTPIGARPPTAYSRRAVDIT